MRSQHQNEDILLRVHSRGDQLQRLLQTRDAGDGIRIPIVVIVYQLDRAVIRGKVLGEHRFRKQRLAFEDTLLAITGEAHEEHICGARFPRRQVLDRGGQPGGLVV
jgi:hypothetical protein